MTNKTTDHTTTDPEFQQMRLGDPIAKSVLDEEPKDKGSAVYMTFLLYGIGVLLPFNVLMACLDFYGDTVSASLWCAFLPFLHQYFYLTTRLAR